MGDGLRLSFRRGDLLAMALVLVLAAGLSLLFWSRALAAEQVVVQIYQDGELVREVSLEQDQTFTLSGDYHNTVTIENGRIAVTHSDCPGGDCVRSGWIGSAGQAVICLPNRVELRVVGAGGDGVDLALG